jgi:choline dehydrogenase-like flavoprotein
MKKFDFIVVGAGAAGAAAAWSLSKKGHSVVCLDRGVWEDNTKLGKTFPEWEAQRATIHSPIPATRRSPYDYPIDDSASPIKVANYNAVGGGTILFSGHFPRFLRGDFEAQKRHEPKPLWPINYEALLPFFEQNEFMMTMAGKLGDPFYPEIRSLNPPVFLGETGRKVVEAFKSLGWHVWPSYAAIETRTSLGGRVHCQNLGPCNNGCPSKSKSTADEIYIRPALELGLEMLTEAAVSQIIVQNNTAVGVEYFDKSGDVKKVFGDKVILAASAIGTPRILLNSQSDPSSGGLANSSEQVGRNLMMHPTGYAEGLFSEEQDIDKGPQGAFLFSLEGRRLNQEGLDLGYMIQVLRGASPISAAKSAFERGDLEFGSRLGIGFDRYYKKQLGMTVVCEDAPRPENQLSISNSNKDRFGVPGVKINYALDANSKKLLAHGLRRARSVLNKLGAETVVTHAPLKNVGWHAMGTTRMGENPQTSVVGPTGETHDVRNLFIFDSSVFPSSSVVNPANTIQSVSLFLTEGLSRE